MPDNWSYCICYDTTAYNMQCWTFIKLNNNKLIAYSAAQLYLKKIQNIEAISSPRNPQRSQKIPQRQCNHEKWMTDTDHSSWTMPLRKSLLSTMLAILLSLSCCTWTHTHTYMTTVTILHICPLMNRMFTQPNPIVQWSHKPNCSTGWNSWHTDKTSAISTDYRILWLV